MAAADTDRVAVRKQPAWAVRHRRALAAAAVVLLAVAAPITVLTLRSGPTSPGEVLKAAHLAANAGRYAEANRHLSQAAIAAYQQQGVEPQAAWDRATHNGQIRSIQLLETTIRGEGAVVRYTVTFNDGTSETDSTRMVKEDGDWKESFDLPSP
jgi:hypothetical protein